MYLKMHLLFDLTIQHAHVDNLVSFYSVEFASIFIFLLFVFTSPFQSFFFSILSKWNEKIKRKQNEEVKRRRDIVKIIEYFNINISCIG